MLITLIDKLHYKIRPGCIIVLIFLCPWRLLLPELNWLQGSRNLYHHSLKIEFYKLIKPQ
jgi:hypothetical protein